MKNLYIIVIIFLVYLTKEYETIGQSYSVKGNTQNSQQQQKLPNVQENIKRCSINQVLCNGNCVGKCPFNQVLDNFLCKCKCNTGNTMCQNNCVSNCSSSNGQVLDTLTCKCKCNIGYTMCRNKCVKNCAANMVLNDDCECSSKCKTKCPINHTQDPSTCACTCSCNDNNKCTTDTCNPVTNKCIFTPKICNAGDQCNTQKCSTLTGMCVNVPKVDGTTCNDNNLCTTGDICKSGICTGTPKACNGGDQCNTQQCSTLTGMCVNVPKADGTACNDNKLCTEHDTCQAGICKGTDKICGDQCHTSTCIEETGTCSEPLQVEDGTSCSDDDLCTEHDTCQAGVCRGADKSCTALDQCYVSTCIAETGECSEPIQAVDGTPCDDGMVCTGSDVCNSGKCFGISLSQNTIANFDVVNDAMQIITSDADECLHTCISDPNCIEWVFTNPTCYLVINSNVCNTSDGFIFPSFTKGILRCGGGGSGGGCMARDI